MKHKIPNKKIWKFEIGYNPAPTRDNIIINYLIIELCYNEVKYYSQFEDSAKFELDENFVISRYNDCYTVFKTEWNCINRMVKK